MKILLIQGSLRDRDGLFAALEGAAEELRQTGLEAEIFRPIKTEGLICSGCGACKGAGMCIYDPRGQDFVKAAAACDGFLFAAPGGLFGLDVDMKNFLERVAALSSRRDPDPLAGKNAAAVVLCRRGGRAAGQMAALLRQLGLRLPEGREVPAVRGDESVQTLRALARLLAEQIMTQA